MEQLWTPDGLGLDLAAGPQAESVLEMLEHASGHLEHCWIPDTPDGLRLSEFFLSLHRGPFWEAGGLTKVVICRTSDLRRPQPGR